MKPHQHSDPDPGINQADANRGHYEVPPRFGNLRLPQCHIVELGILEQVRIRQELNAKPAESFGCRQEASQE
jgi:hypothetical protein